MAFGLVSLAALACTLLLSVLGGARLFQPYFGETAPILVLALVAPLGFASLGVLRSRGWFAISSARTPRGVLLASAAATLFGAWQAGFDRWITRFPRDFNVPLPQSLLFYPAIAYVVEVVFHALPIAVVCALFGRLPERLKPNTSVAVAFAIVVASSLEPVLQMRMGGSVYVGAFVFIFTLVETSIFRRWDFVSMLVFRLVYYLWWHVVWGHLRLRWLFSGS